MMPMVVGSDAAHTPSRFNVRSSMPDATTKGGTHCRGGGGGECEV